MINIEHQPQLVNVTVFGEFTLADYQEFEAAVLDRIQKGGKVHVVFDLRTMLGFTMDVAWEEIKFSRAHAHDFGRIAVITGDEWISWSAWLSGLFVDAEFAVFKEPEPAYDWIGNSMP